jgi:hypothetical protein
MWFLLWLKKLTGLLGSEPRPGIVINSSKINRL